MLTKVLAMPGATADSLERARALEAAGSLAWWSADISRADAMYAEQYAVASRIGDPRAIADAAFELTHTRAVLEPGSAEVSELQARAMEGYASLGDARALDRAAWTSVMPMMEAGRVVEAREMLLALIARFEERGDEFYVAISALALAGAAIAMRDLAGGWHWGIRAMASHHEMGDLASVTLALRGVSVLCLAMDQPEEAALADGAYTGLCQRFGVRPPNDPLLWLAASGVDQAALDDLRAPRYASAIARGSAMSVDEAVAEVVRFARAEGLLGPDAPVITA